MSRRSTTSAMFRKSALLATALGFAAISSIMPAAAKSSGFANFSAREPSFAAPASSVHTISAIASLPAHVVQPTTTGTGHSISQISRLPARVLEPTTTGSGHSVSQISHLPPRVLEPTTTGAGQKITGTAQLPPNRIQPTGPTGGIDNICPFNKFRCPPHNPPVAGGGNPQPPTQNPGSNPSMPGGPYPTGGMGPVVISVPPVVVADPGAVITAPAPVATTTATTAAAAATKAAAAEPCNCLTKQFLDDGSVLFRDLCTKEAFFGTPVELKAQANTSVVR